MLKIVTMISCGLVSVFLLTTSIGCAEREEGKPEKKVEKKEEKGIKTTEKIERETEGAAKEEEPAYGSREWATRKAEESQKRALEKEARWAEKVQAEEKAPEKKEKEAKKETEKDTKGVEGLIREVMSVNDYIQALPEDAFDSDAETTKEDVGDLLLSDIIASIKERDVMAAAYLDMVSGIIEDEITDRRAGEELLRRIDALVDDIEERDWTSPLLEERKKKAAPKEKPKAEEKGGQGKSQ